MKDRQGVGREQISGLLDCYLHLDLEVAEYTHHP